MNRENGLYLCKIKGLQFCEYAVLKWDGLHWWQYYRDLVHREIEGWIASDFNIVEVMEKI